MTVNAHSQPGAAPSGFGRGISWLTPPLTTEERLLHLRTLGQRITDYVQFMCALDKLPGTSEEAKQKALAAFYERFVTLEQQLGRIHDNLRLE